MAQLLVVRRLFTTRMNKHNKILMGFIYCVLLLFCSTISGSLLACVVGGNLRLWPMAAFFLGLFIIGALGYLLVFFGWWVAFFPPRRLLSWFAFLLAAVAAGLLASYLFQVASPLEFDHDADPTPPPVVEMVSLTTCVSCITAVFSTITCYLLIRRFFSNRPPMLKNDAA